MCVQARRNNMDLWPIKRMTSYKKIMIISHSEYLIRNRSWFLKFSDGRSGPVWAPELSFWIISSFTFPTLAELQWAATACCQTICTFFFVALFKQGEHPRCQLNQASHHETLSLLCKNEKKKKLEAQQQNSNPGPRVEVAKQKVAECPHGSTSHISRGQETKSVYVAVAKCSESAGIDV